MAKSRNYTQGKSKLSLNLSSETLV